MSIVYTNIQRGKVRNMKIKSKLTKAAKAAIYFKKQGADTIDSLKLVLLLVKDDNNLKDFLLKVREYGFKVRENYYGIDINTGRRSSKIQIVKDGIIFLNFKCFSKPIC